MHHAISIRAAAEIAGVRQPAIRRAIRDGRITLSFLFSVGERETFFCNLASVVRCYGVEEHVEELIRKWVAHAPIARTPDGREWLLLDTEPVMLMLEPARYAKGNDDAG